MKWWVHFKTDALIRALSNPDYVGCETVRFQDVICSLINEMFTTYFSCSSWFLQQSSVCRAGLHAGVIDNDGGWLDVTRQGRKDFFIKSNKNGVQSVGYGRDICEAIATKLYRWKSHIRKTCVKWPWTEHTLVLCLVCLDRKYQSANAFIVSRVTGWYNSNTVDLVMQHLILNYTCCVEIVLVDIENVSLSQWKPSHATPQLHSCVHTKGLWSIVQGKSLTLWLTAYLTACLHPSLFF